MQIREMPETERPQEKLLYAGPAALSNAELLALVIRTGTNDRSAVQLASDVLEFASANTGALGRADARELMSVCGIGAAKACSIVAALELSKRLMSAGVMEGGRLRSMEDVAALLAQEMMYERREVFMSIHLNTRLQVEAKHIISIGCLDSSLVHPREVFGPAARQGAAAVIVAHNHPSGDPEPSSEDYAVTERLQEASRIMGIKLIDHVVIGSGRYTSMRDLGRITD